MRNRLARVDVTTLAAARLNVERETPTPTLTLNLFDDAVCSGIVERTAPTVSGGSAPSPAAADDDGSAIEALIDLMVGETNQACADSGVFRRGSRKSRRRSAAVMRRG